MRINKKEFDKFWDETLGDDWYIDGDAIDDDGNQDLEIVINNDYLVAWQGSGRLKKSSLPKHVKPSEYDDMTLSGVLTIGLLTLFKRWKKSQSHTTFYAIFTVKKDGEAELREVLKSLGARFME